VSEAPARSTQSHLFDVVRRGYDRQQVDDHLNTLLAQLTEMQQAHQHEHRRASWLENELQNTKAALERASQQAESADQAQGFGYRVEKLLRAAEQEAAEVRTAASREATALLEQARKEAEAHRHEVEQALITRTTALDQQAAQRKVELDERERQIVEQAAAAREEAERVLAEVRRRAEHILEDAKADAERERRAADKAIRDRREEAMEELNRLRGLHDEVRGQLSRLLESLANEFGEQLEPRQRPRPDRPRPSPRPTARVGQAPDRGGNHHFVEPNGFVREPREPLDDQQAS
jgi:chromosome segregation ATPase